MLEFLSNNNNWGINPSNELKLVITDDSMAPTFTSGEILIVDKSTQNMEKILVFILEGKLMARRVKNNDDSGYVLTADNPDYQPIETNTIHIIGTVVASARKA